jgi:branched-chain amino acid transport system substrate-binding protein
VSSIDLMDSAQRRNPWGFRAASGVMVLGISLSLLVGCKPAAPADKAESSAKNDELPLVEPVVFGVLLPLSGPMESFGGDALRGAQLAAKEVNIAGGFDGRPLELAVEDSGSVGIAEAIHRLVSEKRAVVVIGEMTSAATLKAASALKDSKIPLVTPAATHGDVTEAGTHVFRVCYTDPFQAEAMAEFALSVKANTAAVLIEENNSYSEELAAGFRKAFEAGGGTIVAEQTFHAGDRTFTDQLDAINKASADVVFLPSYYAEAALVLREARERGIETPFLGCDGWGSQEFLRITGNASNNCYAATHFSHERPGNPPFINRYVEEFGTPPPPLAALAYDAVTVTAAAWKSKTGPDKFIETLAATSDFPGATGPLTFGPDRSPQKPVVILRIDEGKFHFLEVVDNPGPAEPSERDSMQTKD